MTHEFPNVFPFLPNIDYSLLLLYDFYMNHRNYALKRDYILLKVNRDIWFLQSVQTELIGWNFLLSVMFLGRGNVFSYTHATQIPRCGLEEVLLTVLKPLKEISKILILFPILCHLLSIVVTGLSPSTNLKTLFPSFSAFSPVTPVSKHSPAQRRRRQPTEPGRHPSQ